MPNLTAESLASLGVVSRSTTRSTCTERRPRTPKPSRAAPKRPGSGRINELVVVRRFTREKREKIDGGMTGVVGGGEIAAGSAAAAAAISPAARTPSLRAPTHSRAANDDATTEPGRSTKPASPRPTRRPPTRPPSPVRERVDQIQTEVVAAVGARVQPLGGHTYHANDTSMNKSTSPRSPRRIGALADARNNTFKGLT